ncbi:Transglutaminase-like enzyme, putative cysteine protease [Verrucomicrobium sp. GAS474]|uniref:transglutaminase-like domain-containing protein n=1 Tax=Verrucomicrobium sp. GAS474 TaxID=1882831 RepID=UPI00087D1DCA|nr:transglutaminase family protein [Verrucomicrobium sp. GAS474]SDT89718.1 Transglutaminase-like enzyme, putative cysteine protease [Verrucomicrobium sp. GAS474]
MNLLPPKLTVRVGCSIRYQCALPTPMILVLRPWRDENQFIRQERFSVSPGVATQEYNDIHGNLACRTIMQPGENTVSHDALVDISPEPDNLGHQWFALPVDQLPTDVLRYILPSRYCDSDKLLDFAWQQFGQTPNGIDRVYAICNWLHANIEYRWGGGSPNISASEVIAQRFGVCRDFAHTGIALCRAFNMPARYIVGHLPDIGHIDPGTPMDYHAYFEVYLGGRWCTFDARFNEPRIGRIKVAQGLDAVDGAFSTCYGQAILAWFNVWAYQVNPNEVSVGDPIDLSKRLDGDLLVRR